MVKDPKGCRQHQLGVTTIREVRCFPSLSTISPIQNEAIHVQAIPRVLPSSKSRSPGMSSPHKGLSCCRTLQRVRGGRTTPPFLPTARAEDAPKLE